MIPETRKQPPTDRSRFSRLLSPLVSTRWFTSVVCCLTLCVATSAPSAPVDEAEGSSEAARAAYASAAAFQNREAWELAAEEWATLIKNHPQDPLATKGRYYLGICQLKNDQWAEASKTFKEVIASKADAATVALASWELGRGDFQVAQSQPKPEAFAAAAKSLATFVEKNPGHAQAPEAIFFLGESLWQSNQREKAITTWQRFEREHAASPRMPDVLYALGIGQSEMGNRKEAAVTLKKFADSFATNKLADDVALWRADIAIALNAPADAETILAPVAAGKGPRAAESLERLGTAYWNQKKWAESAAAFGRIADEFPTSKQADRAALSSGMALIEAKKPEAARPRLEKIIAANGAKAVEASHRLAVLELDAKQFARSLEVATKGLETLSKLSDKPDPANAPFLVKLQLDRADALWELPEKKTEAAAVYAVILEKYPDDPAAKTALSMTALALLEQGKTDEAIVKADLFLKKYPPAAAGGNDSIVDVKTIRAEALLAKGNNAAAATAYHDLITGNPQAAQLASWQLREGAALVADKQWQKAHDVLAAATPKLKDAAAAETMLLDATALVELKKLKEASVVLTALDSAHPQWPRRNEALLLAVRAKREMGDKPGALDQAEKLVALFPTGSLADVAWYRLGQLRQDTENFDGAIEAYTKARTLKPKGNRAPWALLASGWCHENKGRLSDAIKAWSDLIDSYPDSTAISAALLARGDARQRTGDFKGGIADAERLLKGHQDGQSKLDAGPLSEAQLLLGLCLMGDKQFAAAVTRFQQLLVASPDFPATDRVLFELGMAQLADAKRNDAESTFRKFVERFPTGSRAAEAWLEIGESKWDAGLWEDAAKAYLAVIATASNGNTAAGGKTPAALLEQAQHKLGWTHVMRKDDAAASKAFSEQLNKDPTGAFAADGQAMLAESLFRTGKFTEASVAFAAALKDPSKLSSDELRSMAALRAIECSAQQEKWAESLALAEQFLALKPAAGSTAQVRYAAAWARQNLGQLDKALAGYREVADASRSELSARARLMEGEVLFEQGQHKDAVKAFFKVAYGFGEKQAPPVYYPWQAQATYEAARCFEVLEKSDQARKLYAELVERYPDSQQTPAARKRLEALGPGSTPTPDQQKKAS